MANTHTHTHINSHTSTRTHTAWTVGSTAKTLQLFLLLIEAVGPAHSFNGCWVFKEKLGCGHFTEKRQLFY